MTIQEEQAAKHEKLLSLLNALHLTSTHSYSIKKYREKMGSYATDLEKLGFIYYYYTTFTDEHVPHLTANGKYFLTMFGGRAI